MKLTELQEDIDAWVRTYGVRYFSELTNLASSSRKWAKWPGS